MVNYLVAAAVILIVALASFYVYKSKKSGKKCIGCPYACDCSKKNCNK